MIFLFSALLTDAVATIYLWPRLKGDKIYKTITLLAALGALWLSAGLITYLVERSNEDFTWRTLAILGGTCLHIFAALAVIYRDKKKRKSVSSTE